MTRYAEYGFALYSGLPYRIVGTPQLSVGFEPRFKNPRVHILDFDLREEAVKASVRSADRVIVVHWLTHNYYDQYVLRLGNMLKADGFEVTSQKNVNGTLVVTFERTRHP